MPAVAIGRIARDRQNLLFHIIRWFADASCSLATSEVFNQRRMDRCAEIQRSIMIALQKNNSFQYLVRATESVEGLTLAISANTTSPLVLAINLPEIPFHDMLVVFQ